MLELVDRDVAEWPAVPEIGDTDSRLGARRLSAGWPSDIGGGPGAVNVLFSRGRWGVARDERSGIAPFRRDTASRWSGLAQEGFDRAAQRGPGAGPRVAIQSLSEFLPDGTGHSALQINS